MVVHKAHSSPPDQLALLSDVALRKSSQSRYGSALTTMRKKLYTNHLGHTGHHWRQDNSIINLVRSARPSQGEQVFQNDVRTVFPA